jgi:hypothetical protein
MPSANWLVKRLRQDFPQFQFVAAPVSRWSPPEQTVYFASDAPAETLHELGHALLGHADFVQDVELLVIERDAWDKARGLAPNYAITIDDDTVEDAMDEYRDWLHARSLCPNCGQTGVQSRTTGDYDCLNCAARWRANDARRSGLRRLRRSSRNV